VRYYQDAPELEEVTRNDVEGEKRKKKDRHRAQKGYTRFFINIGKKDHVQPVHIIEMLNRNVAGRVDVGRIDLMQNFSFFECPEEFTEEIVIGMDGINYKGRQVHVEVAETRSEDGDEADAASARERKPRAERKPRYEEKPSRERKPKKEEKPRREDKPRKESKPTREEKVYREEKTSRTPKRAPQVQIAQDDDFWNNFENEDWHQFFRSEGAGKSRKKSSARKEKPARKEKVNGRKAARTKPSRKSRR
jgi:ATP-dependent RNA helicase DeaD